MSEASRRADRWASFRLHLLGRAITCAAILSVIGVVGLTVDTVEDTWPIAVLMAVALVLTGPYFFLGKACPERLREISLGVILAEVGLLAVGVYLLGGKNSLYGLPLYGILIIMAATLHSDRAAYAVAVVGAASYAAVVVSPSLGLIPPHASPSVLTRPDAWPVTSGLVNLFFGLAMAAVAGSLSRLKETALDRSERAELQLRALNRNLEERVEEAVEALRATNQSLQRRNSELAGMLQQVNLFATAVSHDLRNPMTAASEALRISEELGSLKRHDYVALARENLARADRMIVGLRELMRVVGTRTAPGEILVGPLVEELLDDLRAEGLGQPLPVELKGALGSIQGDQQQIKHVFRNLITNALIHNSGAKDLRVTVRREDRADETCFAVSDNGKGIAPEVQARIFEPFHRGPGNTTEGLGLGLALVKAIVTRAGGSVSVESSPGSGSTFRFTLPRKAPLRNR